MQIRHFFAAIATALCASCSAPKFSIEPTLGKLDAKGDISLTDSGNQVVHNTLDDLGISGKESSLGVRADFKWGIPHLTLGTQGARWSGSGQVSGTFGGIPGNTQVDSDMKVAVHQALITFDVVPTKTVEFGIGLGVEALALKASVTDPTAANPPEKIDEVLPIPVLAVRAGVSVWRLEFEALVSGMSANINGDHGAFYDTDVSARLRLFSAGPVDAHLTLGYRRIDVDAKYNNSGDSASANFTLDGLYAGLRVSI